MVKYSSWKVLIRRATYVVLIFPFLIPRSFNSSKQGVVWNNLMIVHGTLTILCCSVGRKKQSIDQPSRSFMKYFQLIRSMPMQGKSGRCWGSNESIRTNFLKLDMDRFSRLSTSKICDVWVKQIWKRVKSILLFLLPLL